MTGWCVLEWSETSSRKTLFLETGIEYGELDKKCEGLWGKVSHIFKGKTEMTGVCAGIYPYWWRWIHPWDVETNMVAKYRPDITNSFSSIKSQKFSIVILKIYNSVYLFISCFDDTFQSIQNSTLKVSKSNPVFLSIYWLFAVRKRMKRKKNPASCIPHPL